MCSIEDYDSPDFHAERDHRARVRHICTECSRTICPGEAYRKAFSVYEGKAHNYKTCSHCLVGQEWLLNNCGGFMHYGLSDEMQEHADAYYDQKFGFLRIHAGIKRKWQRFDGAGLMRLPPKPAAIGEWA